MNFAHEVERLVAELRKRDADPSYADAPIEDVYGRISHVNTGSDNDKPIVQIFYLLTDMLGRDVRLGDTFMDTNRSAWKDDGPRPGWDAVVARVAAGTVAGVRSVMVDRMMRQTGQLVDMIRAFERNHGRDVGFTVFDLDADRSYNTSRPDDTRDLEGRVSAAKHDSAIKSRKIRRGNHARRLAGNGRNGAAPFGHRWNVADVDDAQLAVERAAIAWGIVRITDGGTWGEVARRWNEDGVLPRRHPRWHSQNVRACLTLARHAGLLIHAGHIVGTIVSVDGPIVTLPQWHAFDNVVSKRQRGRQRGDKVSRYYASGTVWCGGTRDDGTPCETLLVGTAQSGVYADTGERRYGYKCPPRGCRGVTVDGRAVEEHASFLTGKAIVAGDNMALLAHVGHDDRLVELDKLIADAELAIDNKERQRDAATHPSRRERFVVQLVDAEARLSALLTERDGLHETVRRERLKPSDVDELSALWDSPTTPAAKRRTIVRQCVPGGFYVRPVGKGARLRGEAIFTRFYTKGGDA